MKEVIEEAPIEPPPQTVIIDGKERKVTFDYYVHYVGHQRRNDRWCHQDEIKIDEDEIKRQFSEIEKRERELKELEEFMPNNEHLGLSEK